MKQIDKRKREAIEHVYQCAKAFCNAYAEFEDIAPEACGEYLDALDNAIEAFGFECDTYEGNSPSPMTRKEARQYGREVLDTVNCYLSNGATGTATENAIADYFEKLLKPPYEGAL